MKPRTFIWDSYHVDHEKVVENLLDFEAVRFTGCDEGFKAFYDYWKKELDENSFWCKTIFLKEKLIAVIALAEATDGVFTIQELIVSPDCRNMGYGSAILSELLYYSSDIIGRDIHMAKAVIFSDNLASKKAFEKAGFVCVKANNDVLNFEYGESEKIHY